jgi:flagellar P-ring protein precursor FlgI
MLLLRTMLPRNPNLVQDYPLRKMRAIIAVLFALTLWAGSPARADVRIKDIADVEGVRQNQLIGYGLVVGLNGTGDKLNNNVFTRESLIGMLERLGVNTRDQVTALSTKNLAAVMVTAELPAFARSGSRIDISVSALGDASNLTGGTLLVTPLLAADGEVYAVGQGTLSTGAIAARGAAASVTRGVPTSARIINGATVEKEVAFNLEKGSALWLGLRNPDLTTAQRISSIINKTVGPIAKVTDPRTVRLELAGRDPIDTLSQIENLRVEPDNAAIVVIDEASGTIVMGANVRISTVAIAQGNLTIRVTETPEVSQPEPFSKGGTTTVVPRTKIDIDDQHDKKLGILSGGVTLRDLVASLNALGVGPRDMISILQAIKAAGALQADLEVR